jgi:hypothetical protein
MARTAAAAVAKSVRAGGGIVGKNARRKRACAHAKKK